MHHQHSQQIYQIELRRLADSPFQPRSNYRGIHELAASIRVDGILEPILARPITNQTIGSDPEQDIEVVAGHRRLRAARLAGLEEAPVIIRPMTDAEAKRVALVENIQRDNLSAIEDARALRALVEDGEKVRDIARDVGKSERYVYARLGLLRLTGRALTAAESGAIPAEIGVLISSFAPTLQARALDLCAPDGGTLSLRKAREALKADGLIKPLSQAPFPLWIVLDTATGCSLCTLNSTNMGSDERDQLSDDVCTHPPCYAAKAAHHVQQELEQRRATGWLIGDGQSPCPVYQPLEHWVKDIAQATAIDAIRTARCCCAWVRNGILYEYLTQEGYYALKDILGKKDEPTPLPASQKADSSGAEEVEAPSVATAPDRSDREPSDVTSWWAGGNSEMDRIEALRDAVVDAILTCETDMRTHDELTLVTAASIFWLDGTFDRRIGLNQLGTFQDRLDDLRARSPDQLGRILLASVVMQIDDWMPVQQDSKAVLLSLADRYCPEAKKVMDERALAGADEVSDESGLSASPPSLPGKGARVRYKCPDTGSTWTGRGMKPRWLTEALHAGKTLDYFEVTA